jgi:hypothetical protein
MDIGKSVAWILFLAVVAVAGSFTHHEEPAPPPGPGKPSVQMAAPQQAPGAATVALDTTHAMATRVLAPAVK